MSWKWRTKKMVSICDTWGCCSSKNLRRETGLLLLICWLKRNVHFGFVFWLIFATVAYRVKERENPKLHFRCKMRWFFSWTKRRRFLQTLVFEMVYNWTKKRVRRVRTWLNSPSRSAKTCLPLAKIMNFKLVHRYLLYDNRITSMGAVYLNRS